MPLIFFSLISTPVFSGTLTDEIKPSVLKDLSWDKSLKKETVHKNLGKPQLKEKNKEYYEIAGMKYPLSFEYKEEKVTKLYARLLSQKINIETLLPKLKSYKKIEALEDENELFYYMESSDKKIKLKFSVINNNLYSVERWY